MHNVKDTYQYQGIGRGRYCIRGISNKQNMRFCSFLSFPSFLQIPSHPIHISRNTSYVRPQERTPYQRTAHARTTTSAHKLAPLNLSPLDLPP